MEGFDFMIPDNKMTNLAIPTNTILKKFIPKYKDKNITFLITPVHVLPMLTIIRYPSTRSS